MIWEIAKYKVRMLKTCHYIKLAEIKTMFSKNQNWFKKLLKKRAIPLFCMFMVTNLYHSYLNLLHYVFTVLNLLKLQIFIFLLYLNSVTTQMFIGRTRFWVFTFHECTICRKYAFKHNMQKCAITNRCHFVLSIS